MQGLTASSKVCLIFAMIFLLGLAGVAHGRRMLVSSYDEPCKQMKLYYHDILYVGDNLANATSAAATKPTPLSTSHWKNGTYFGMLVVFDDPMTNSSAPPAPGEETAARAQGFYIWDKKEYYNAWFAFSIVFNSTAYKGTLNLMGAEPLAEKTRDISVVGGTGDFFMARGVATLSGVASKNTFWLLMDIKLYECYV